MSKQNNPSVDAFLRFVNERFGDFKNKLSEVIAVLGWQEQQQKIPKAAAALDAAKSLQQALASQDQPQWLSPLINALQQYDVHQGQPHVATALITAIGNHFAAMSNHQWAFDFSGDRPFDFDGLYRQYEADSRIPELFDRLVTLLEEIVQSDQIDSRKIVHALETIIATLKRNRKRSYFSTVCTWDFAGTYLKNVAWGVLKEIPVLRVPVVALREAMQELDKEMSKVHEGMQTELHKQLEAEFPVLVYQSLPLPELLALPDETVIDVEATPVGTQEKLPKEK